LIPVATFRLPLPPSANRMYRKGRGGVIHKAQDYTAWVREVQYACMRQAPGFHCAYRYEIRIVLPEQRKDPDNLLKPTQDALAKAGLIANDKHARLITVEVQPEHPADAMSISLRALPDEPPKRRKRTLKLACPQEPLR
jgi:Holliday junction resolvase RusA-like endonuclease